MFTLKGLKPSESQPFHSHISDCDIPEFNFVAPNVTSPALACSYVHWQVKQDNHLCPIGRYRTWDTIKLNHKVWCQPRVLTHLNNCRGFEAMPYAFKVQPRVTSLRIRWSCKVVTLEWCTSHLIFYDAQFLSVPCYNTIILDVEGEPIWHKWRQPLRLIETELQTLWQVRPLIYTVCTLAV